MILNDPVEDVARRAIAGYRQALAELDELKAQQAQMRSERPRVANAKAKDLGNVIRRQHRQLKASESARVEAQEQVRELSERVRALEAKLGEQRSRPARREPVRHALAEVPAADDHLEDGIREAARRRSLRDIERRLGRIGWEAYTATR